MRVKPGHDDYWNAENVRRTFSMNAARVSGVEASILSCARQVNLQPLAQIARTPRDMVGEQRADDAAVDVEHHARRPDAVEPALQHRGQAVPPGGIDEDDRLGAFQPRDLGLDAFSVAQRIVVAATLLGIHDGAEILGIEVGKLHRVAAGRERRAHRVAQGRDVRVAARMAVDDEDLHDRAPSVRSTFWRKAARDASVERFMS